jgi:CheY-like chemotaxis protein
MSETSRILVADDDRVTCDLLKEVLEKEGYSVRTVLSGEDAIEQGKESPSDLLICDIKMKGLDGLDVLRAFKQFSPDTSVILITGFPVPPI